MDGIPRMTDLSSHPNLRVERQCKQVSDEVTQQAARRQQVVPPEQKSYTELSPDYAVEVTKVHVDFPPFVGG